MNFKRKSISAGLVVALTVIGCSANQKILNEGRVATQERRVILETGGPHEGVWDSFDVILKYNYTGFPDKFEFKGNVNLVDRYDLYNQVARFSVVVNFMDKDFLILKSVMVAGQASSIIRQWNFNYSPLELPAGTHAFNVSYSGVAFEGGSEGGGMAAASGGGSSWSFWKLP